MKELSLIYILIFLVAVSTLTFAIISVSSAIDRNTAATHPDRDVFCRSIGGESHVLSTPESQVTSWTCFVVK